MATPDHAQSGGLHPFLNREYWDGYMLGDGQPTPIDPNTFTGPYFGSTARFAKRALCEYLSVMHTSFPIKTYNRGVDFDPEEWDPGTVALFDREILRFPKPKAALDAEIYEAQAVPSRPTDLHPHLDRRDLTGTTVIKDDALGVSYIRTVNWGVVVATKSGRKALQRASTSGTFKNGLTGKVHTDVMLPEPVPIKVGKTHYSKGGDERLTRVNILQIVSAGSEQRKESGSFARGWLSWLAPDSA